MDWAAGGDRLELDGTVVRGDLEIPFECDAAVATPDGEWAVAYNHRGTAGLLIREGEIVRELPRAEYHASDYMYPVCLFRDAEGRALIAHCPREYDTIDIEDAQTGEILTDDDTRDPSDFFQSRLEVSPNGRWLLSSGWVWHPWDAVNWYDLHAAQRDPTALDGFDPRPEYRDLMGAVEMSYATFRSDSTVLIGTSTGYEDDPEDDDPPPLLNAMHVGTYDIEADQWLDAIALRHPPGRLMSVGEHFVISFWDHPRLYRLTDGALLHEWSDLTLQTHMSSIVMGDWPIPVIATDPARGRFAVVTGDEITAVGLDLDALP